MSAEIILHNAKIATNGVPSFVEAIVIADGKVTASGGNEEILRLRGPATRVIDGRERNVIPGLNDSHMHPIRGGLNYNLELRWDGVPSLADALRMLKDQAARTPAPQWVRVIGGWTEFQFKVKTGIGSWQIDGFAMRPDLDKPGFFDNAPDHSVGFWGIYGVRPVKKSLTIDTYYLGLDRTSATFNRGTAHEVRHSIGARLSRPIAETKAGWDFDYEALWQFGSFGSANIRAWTVASETGYRFPTVPLKPRFSAKADISSGDDPRTNTLATFNPLFPKGNYFGVLATAGPGPINFIDVHPHVETTLPHNLTVSVDWIFQWRESLRDGVHSVPGFLIIPAGKSDARFVGQRPGTELHWQANRHLWFQADCGVFYAGKFIKESQPGRNLNYWALWAGYKF